MRLLCLGLARCPRTLNRSVTHEGIGNLKQAIADLALASFRGYAHLEIIRAADGAPVELAHVPQWFWCRHGIGGDWMYNRDCRFGARDGEQVDMARFISRDVDRPINRVALVAFLRKSLSQKDWDAFVETYGVPAIFLVMPEQLGEEQRDAFQETAEGIISDARGVLPGNSDVKTVDNGARGVNPFRDHIKHQDEQVVLPRTREMMEKGGRRWNALDGNAAGLIPQGFGTPHAR